VCPVQHILREPLVDQPPLEEEADDGRAEVRAELVQVEGGHVHEVPLVVEAAFQEEGVEVGIPPPTARIPWVCGSRFGTRFIPGVAGSSRYCVFPVIGSSQSSSSILGEDT
jgi:hypothetical protein